MIIILAIITGIQQAVSGAGKLPYEHVWLWSLLIGLGYLVGGPYWAVPIAAVMYAVIESSPNELFKLEWAGGSSSPWILVRYSAYQVIASMVFYLIDQNQIMQGLAASSVFGFIAGIYYFITRRYSHRLPNFISTRVAEFNRGFFPVIGFYFGGF